jgi:hypothetical protein
MAATILESLVLREVSVVTTVAAEERIGSQMAAGLTSARIPSFLSPSYPGNKPSKRPWDNQDDAAARAGRSGSLRSVLASRSLTMRASGLALMRKHRGQSPAGALTTHHHGGRGFWPTAIRAVVGARATAPCEPTVGASTASTRGKRAVAG